MPKKAGKSKSLLALVFILIITNAATVYYFMFYQPSVPAENVPLSLEDITENPTSHIGEVLTLEGYYVKSNDFHLLISNPAAYVNNSLNPSNYVMITGTIPDSMSDHIGDRVAVKGEIGWGDEADQVLSIDFSDLIASSSKDVYPGVFDDSIQNVTALGDLDIFQYDPDATKYAVLYSGGIKPEKAYYRYWNDIAYMNFILLMHGYEAENIYIVYKDGVAEDPYTTVDYPATNPSMNTLFDDLSTQMGFRDTLFFYTTNHGGYGGISVWNPMDEAGVLTHNHVASLLDSITCQKMIIVMEQCVSGKFIEYISAPERVILTACGDDEGSAGCDTEGQWDEFVYHFMSGLIGWHLNGDGSCNADFDEDGLISMREAFVYAAAMDSRSETPRYNDNGNGVMYTMGQVAWNTGWYGDSIFL